IVETTSIMTLLSLLQQTDMIGITPRSVIEDYPGKHLLAILPIQLEPRLFGMYAGHEGLHGRGVDPVASGDQAVGRQAR
ncbi:hypothetical protein ACV33M_32070, partial [Pseudomonas aeruginosa]